MKLRKVFESLPHTFKLSIQYFQGIRYRIDHNALRMIVRTYKDLDAQPIASRKRLVLFAHYDPYDLVDPYVQYYIQQLHALDCTIVFVSGSPHLRPEAAQTIEKYCAAIYTCHSLSLDFGSWNLAWQQLQQHGWLLESFDQLILANDSVYGPLFDLSEMFSHLGQADIHGVTDSLEQTYHLQSYFLVFRLSPEVCAFVRKFWADFRYIVRKPELIKRYELGLTALAQQNGLSVSAYIPCETVREAGIADLEHQHRAQILDGAPNNTLYLWDILISRFRCPFLKTDLPKKNRYHSTKILELSQFLMQWTTYDAMLIEGHLERLGIRHADPNNPNK